MRHKKLLFALFILLSFLAIAGFYAQNQNQIARKQLREMLVQLGYEVKDTDTAAGQEKYEFVVTQENLDIPITAEISGSMNYVWLSVYLGDPKQDKALNLLKKNHEIQPSQFYVTKSDKLMCALPIENRGITNTILRQRVEKLALDVAKTESDWR